MAQRTLEITSISAKDLTNVNLLGKTEVSADVSISGDPQPKKRTPIYHEVCRDLLGKTEVYARSMPPVSYPAVSIGHHTLKTILHPAAAVAPTPAAAYPGPEPPSSYHAPPVGYPTPSFSQFAPAATPAPAPSSYPALPAGYLGPEFASCPAPPAGYPTGSEAASYPSPPAGYPVPASHLSPEIASYHAPPVDYPTIAVGQPAVAPIPAPSSYPTILPESHPMPPATSYPAPPAGYPAPTRRYRP